MKKKILVLGAALCMACLSAFSIGIGPQVNVNPLVPIWDGSSTWGAACSVKFDSMPIYWAFGFDSGYYTYEDEDGHNVHTTKYTTSVTGDYHISEGKFTEMLGWYWGFGAVFTASFTGKHSNYYLSAGPRIYFGMNCKFNNDTMEAFIQTAAQPELGLAFGEDGKENGFIRPALYIPTNLGIRFWF